MQLEDVFNLKQKKKRNLIENNSIEFFLYTILISSRLIDVKCFRVNQMNSFLFAPSSSPKYIDGEKKIIIKTNIVYNQSIHESMRHYKIIAFIVLLHSCKIILNEILSNRK